MADKDKPLQLRMSNELSRLPNAPPFDPMAQLATLVDHPAYNVAQMIPGVNIPANALAYVSHVQRGQTGDAVWDSLGMIPGVGMLKGAKALDSMKDWGQTVASLAKNYPNAMSNVARQMPDDMVNSLRLMARMTGRQVGNVSQVKQGIDAGTSTASAAVNNYD